MYHYTKHQIDSVYPARYVFCMRKKLTALRMDKDHYARLEKIGQREDRPVSWLIRKAIEEFLKREEKKTQPSKARE